MTSDFAPLNKFAFKFKQDNNKSMGSLNIKINDDLELRQLSLGDAEELFRLTDENRSYLREWLSWVDKSQSVEDTEKFIQLGLEEWEKRIGVEFGIWHKGKPAGCIGLHELNQQNHKTVIGYWLAEKFQGKGIMTDSVKALINYLFDELKLNRIEIHCAVGNEKSCAIPERLGFTNEGVMREAEWLNDHYVDWNLYALLASDWNKSS